MSYCDLLERMMDKDTAAFLEMTDRYGWTLYSEIRKKHPDREEADRIYRETMQQFYRSLQEPGCEDPMEALLLGFAGTIGEKQGASSASPAPSQPQEPLPPPTVALPASRENPPSPPQKRKGRFWFRFGMLLVLAGFLAVLWITVGLLMEAGMIPYCDLGYTWFANLAAHWL